MVLSVTAHRWFVGLLVQDPGLCVCSDASPVYQSSHTFKLYQGCMRRWPIIWAALLSGCFSLSGTLLVLSMFPSLAMASHAASLDRAPARTWDGFGWLCPYCGFVSGGNWYSLMYTNFVWFGVFLCTLCLSARCVSIQRLSLDSAAPWWHMDKLIIRFL